MSSENETTGMSHIQTFDRAASKFGRWMAYLRGLCLLKGILDCLLPLFANRLPDSANYELPTNEQKKAVKMNRTGTRVCAIAITSPKLMTKIDNMQTEGCPSAVAYKVVKMLERNFCLNDAISMALQKKKLSSSELKTEEDPNDFGTAVDGLEIQYMHNFNIDGKVAVLVSTAGPEYTSTILSKTQRLKSDGTITFDNLIEALTQHWMLSGPSIGKYSLTPGETTLATFDTKRKSGKCFRCGSAEHKRGDCSMWKAMRKVKCDYPGCPLYGHTKDSC